MKLTKELYDAHYGWLFRVAYKFLNNQITAQDAVQDTFIKYYGYHAEEKNHEKYVLAHILRNICLDEWRKKKRHQIVGMEGKEDRMYEEPSIKYDHSLIATIVETEMEKLTPQFKKVFKLRYKMGLSYEEIADITNKSTHNVRQLYFKSFTKIKKRIELLLFNKKPKKAYEKRKEGRTSYKVFDTLTGKMLKNGIKEAATLTTDAYWVVREGIVKKTSERFKLIDNARKNYKQTRTTQ